MTVDTARPEWMARAEAEIRSLKDVEDVTVRGDGDVISEIHVTTRSNKREKQIARDVITVLEARMKRPVDHRKVSVARLESPAGNGAAPADGQATVVSGTPATPPARATTEPERAVAERIRFLGVNLFVSGPRAQAQVELRWRGLPRMGSASGMCTRAGASELIARATLAAVQEFLAEDVALAVQDLEILRLGRRRTVVVSLSMLSGRQERILVGGCAIEQDPQQAVVYATLAALNRVVSGLRPKEPTEYVLRPTSVT